jgi:hypothetical protein
MGESAGSGMVFCQFDEHQECKHRKPDWAYNPGWQLVSVLKMKKKLTGNDSA